MKIQPFVFALAAASAVIWLSAVQPAGAGSSYEPVDVTGTWQGTITCKGLGTGGQLNSFSNEIVVAILVDANGNVAADFEPGGVVGGTEPPADGLCGSSVHAQGKTNKGLLGLGLTSVGNADVMEPDVPIQAATLKVTVFAEKNGVSGKMKGSGVLTPFLGTVGTCKLKLERTDANAPVMDTDLLAECSLSVGA